MGIKSKEKGVLSVDAGDVVCFSYDAVMQMAEQCEMNTDAFIKQFQGVECGFGCDGGYGVDQVTAVQQDGSTYNVVIIGGNTDTLRRFLLEDEQEFSEFYENHPNRGGDKFDQEKFAEIAAEYYAKLLSHPCNLQENMKENG